MYRRSLVRPNTAEDLRLLTCAVRKDSAVHVSLSSSSLVKQPESARPSPSQREAPKPPSDGNHQPTTIGWIKHSSQWRASKARQQGRGTRPRRCRRAQWPPYKPARSGLSTPDVNKSSHGTKIPVRSEKLNISNGRINSLHRSDNAVTATSPPRRRQKRSRFRQEIFVRCRRLAKTRPDR